jgi:hypothetical protein
MSYGLVLNIVGGCVGIGNLPKTDRVAVVLSCGGIINPVCLLMFVPSGIESGTAIGGLYGLTRKRSRRLNAIEREVFLDSELFSVISDPALEESLLQYFSAQLSGVAKVEIADADVQVWPRLERIEIDDTSDGNIIIQLTGLMHIGWEDENGKPHVVNERVRVSSSGLSEQEWRGDNADSFRKLLSETAQSLADAMAAHLLELIGFSASQ